MTTGFTWATATVVAVAALAALASRDAVGASGQAGAATADGRAVSRRVDGKPDFSGIWQVMNAANSNILPHAASKDGPGGLGVVEADELPYQPSALARKQENYKNRMTADTDAKCFLPGVPRVMYEPYPFEILQTPTVVTMVFEYGHAMRNIYMNTPHPPGPINWWMGDSRGRWDGETLVVDAVYFTDQTWFDRTGNYHSEDLHVVERYTLPDRDHINYEATIEDPKVFTRPWKMRMIFYRHKEPYTQLLEYECYTFEDEAGGNLTQPKGPQR